MICQIQKWSCSGQYLITNPVKFNCFEQPTHNKVNLLTQDLPLILLLVLHILLILFCLIKKISLGQKTQIILDCQENIHTCWGARPLSCSSRNLGSSSSPFPRWRFGTSATGNSRPPPLPPSPLGSRSVPSDPWVYCKSTIEIFVQCSYHTENKVTYYTLSSF